MSDEWAESSKERIEKDRAVFQETSPRAFFVEVSEPGSTINVQALFIRQPPPFLSVKIAGVVISQRFR